MSSKKYNALEHKSDGSFVSGHEFIRIRPLSVPKKKILHPNKGHVERLRETSLCSNFQRDVHGAKYNLGIRGRFGSEVARQGQAAVSVDDRKI